MRLHSLSAYADALCSDGSPAGYYWQPAAAESGDWIVMLLSGGWCWDAPSCEERCGGERRSSHLCSSRAWPAEREATGVLASPHPRLGAANKILVPYCTSDAHMGDAAAFGLEFRGAAVVRAVLHDLVTTRGLGPGARLLFGGVSAGARGAMVHLDYVRGMLPLPREARRRVEVRGLIDSAMWLDDPPLRPWASTRKSFFGLANATANVASFANVTHLGEECAEEHADELWRCLFGAYRLLSVRTPYLAVGSQFDTYQLDNDFGGCGHWGCRPSGPEEEAFAWRFADETAALARSLAVGERYVYSSRCHRHADSLGGDFFLRGCGGVSMQAALLRLLEEPATLPGLWIDEQCDHFDCCCRPADRTTATAAAASLAAIGLCVAAYACSTRGRRTRSSRFCRARCGGLLDRLREARRRVAKAVCPCGRTSRHRVTEMNAALVDGAVPLGASVTDVAAALPAAPVPAAAAPPPRAVSPSPRCRSEGEGMPEGMPAVGTNGTSGPAVERV